LKRSDICSIQTISIKTGSKSRRIQINSYSTDTTTDWHSCFGGLWIKYHTRDWFFWPWVLMVFLSSFKNILNECFRLGQEHFLPHSFLILNLPPVTGQKQEGLFSNIYIYVYIYIHTHTHVFSKKPSVSQLLA